MVTATATDVADTVAGQDRWRITYRLTGEMPAFYGVTLFLPTDIFTSFPNAAPTMLPQLDVTLSPGSPGSDSVLTLSPQFDIGLADFIDYSLDFVHSGLPFQPQSYEFTDDAFTPIGSGTLDIAIVGPTEVPEPTSLALVGLGLAMLRRVGARPQAH